MTNAFCMPPVSLFTKSPRLLMSVSWTVCSSGEAAPRARRVVELRALEPLAARHTAVPLVSASFHVDGKGVHIVPGGLKPFMWNSSP